MAQMRAIDEREVDCDEVLLDWRRVLSFRDGERDRAIIASLVERLEHRKRAVVLVGQQRIAEELSKGSWLRPPRLITQPYKGDPPSALLEALAQLSDATVFICEDDRYNGAQIAAALPAGIEAFDFDVLTAHEALQDGENWLAKYDHIYPFKTPTLEINAGLDVLLLDVPARSLAQLPIGFAYVYKAVKATGLSVQAIDVDVIAYHRYHARRCLNQWPNVIEPDGRAHPADPWQAADYLCWTDPKFIDYFNDLLEQVVKQIIAAKPKVIGFSLHQTSHAFIQRVVDRIKPVLPDTCVIVGGMSCYQNAVALHIFPDADYVVVGESDTAVGPLVLALVRGERPRDLPGIVSHFDTPGRKFIGAPLPHNLDFLGAPDYGFTDLDVYRNWNNYRLMPVVGSRGCGWSRCTFCAERFNWRARTPEKVAEEIEYYTTRGFQDFVFNESDFNSNPEFVVRLCKDIIRRGLDIRLTAQLRISKNSDFEYFEIMRKAGFSCLRFGVDGLSRNTLKLQKKGYVKEDVINNLRDCSTLGIYTEINVVIGVPGETEEDVEETADFIVEMKPFIGRVAFINPLMMFVGSVYYNEPEKHGIRFRRDQKQLYSEYVVSLPDDSWYSVDPYIDHEVRRDRFMRIVRHLHAHGVPMGDFAAFTAKHREEFLDDSHTIASVRTRKSATAHETPDHGTPAESQELGYYGAWSAYDRAQAAKGERVEGKGETTPTPLSTLVRHVEGKILRSRPSVSRIKTRYVAHYATPTLLENFQGYNLVGVGERVFGAPLCAGVLDLRRAEDQNHPEVISGGSVEEVRRIIGWVVRAAGGAREHATPVRAEAPQPELLETHRGYNIVRYGASFLAAPLALGQLDLRDDAQRRSPGILVAETHDQAVAAVDYVLARSARALAPRQPKIRALDEAL